MKMNMIERMVEGHQVVVDGIEGLQPDDKEITVEQLEPGFMVMRARYEDGTVYEWVVEVKNAKTYTLPALD